MDEKKQIEEMGFIIQENSSLSQISSEDVAESLYNAGYCKQREGEWVEDTEYYDDDYSECNVRKVFVCSKCGRTEKRKEPYCNCGAKMKGGAE
jgi:hypothetical protein